MRAGRKKRVPRGERSRALPDRQTQEVERLKQENERLRKQVAEQEKQIADLERQLALRQQNSTTTSKPPSSDGLAGQQGVRGRRVKSWPHAGGQPGHPGTPSRVRARRACGYDHRSDARHVSPVCAPLARAARRAASSIHGVAKLDPVDRPMLENLQRALRLG